MRSPTRGSSRTCRHGCAGAARGLGALVPLLEPLMAPMQRLPIDAIQTLFALMDPGGIAAKYAGFARLEPDSARAQQFVAIEDWLNDGVPLAAAVARECLGGWYGENTPAGGRWRVAGERVEPARLRMPAFVAVPARDRIVPPESARPLAGLDPAWGVPVPPVFAGGTALLTAEDEAAASALYWQAVNRGLPLTTPAPTVAALQEAIGRNPWVGEPRLMLAQIALGQADWAMAEREAAAGLTLLAQWGTPWDKRIAWSGWVSWARILLQSAQRRHWPETLEGLNALGLVTEG